MSDGVLTSSWCTAWQSYNTPRLWAMVADEDDPEAWRQVAAWGEISGSVKDQRNLLLKAREDLVAAWPPEDNKSSAAFVEELDTLIARMDTARTDADDTATGLANILEALRQAKNAIQPLYEDYKEKNDDLVPSWWDNAEDDIDEKARAHMITAEGIVQDNVARLKVPAPYKLEPPERRWGDPKPPGEPDPTPTTGSGGGGSVRSAGADGVRVPHDPVPPLPGHEPTIPDGVAGPVTSPVDTSPGTGSGAGTSGPGLAGVITPPGVTPPVAPPTGTPGLPGTGGLPGGGVVPPGVLPTPGPIGGGGGGLGGGGLGGLGRGAPRPIRPGAGTSRALPSGAVIGETVGGTGRGFPGSIGGAAGRGVSGRSGGVPGRAGSAPGRSGSAPGRVGSVPGQAGGVSGRGGMSRAGAVAPAGEGKQVRPPRPSWLPEEPAGTARGANTVGMAGSSRGGRRSGDGSGQDYDPDNPWQVAEGVDPVIAPSRYEAVHDPGPNVIGWRG
ncbi:hypothetical protein AB0368_28435 [Actinoplanes sp. NPDC051475]|uniref:hypothetical protein n=1 Tax=Actinoplanes sp. NPDC051475 TaxID=3157225 RepID=UPI00344E2DC4